MWSSEADTVENWTHRSMLELIFYFVQGCGVAEGSFNREVDIGNLTFERRGKQHCECHLTDFLYSSERKSRPYPPYSRSWERTELLDECSPWALAPCWAWASRSLGGQWPSAALVRALNVSRCSVRWDFGLLWLEVLHMAATSESVWGKERPPWLKKVKERKRAWTCWSPPFRDADKFH